MCKILSIGNQNLTVDDNKIGNHRKVRLIAIKTFIIEIKIQNLFIEKLNITLFKS